MFANFLYYRYPQYIWAQEINGILGSGLIRDLPSRKIVDAPCGDGIISFWVRKKHPNLNFDLYDLDESLVKRAQNNCPNTSASVQSIFDISLDGESNIWMLINSLYCLPDKEALLNHLVGNVEYIVGVFPHTDHINYQAFLEKNPEFKNTSAMGQAATIKFFSDYGFKRVFLKDVGFIPQYARSGFRLPWITKRALNFVDRFYSHRKACYWLAVFEKDKNVAR